MSSVAQGTPSAGRRHVVAAGILSAVTPELGNPALAVALGAGERRAASCQLAGRDLSWRAT